MEEVVPSTDDERLKVAFQREKRAFVWTCIWLCLLAPAWTGQIVFAHVVRKEIARMKAIDSTDYLPELESYVLARKPWLDASEIAVALLATGFGICLMRWLLAIQRRRQIAIGRTH